VVLVCLAIILCFPILGLDTTRMASGVFRFGLFDENTSKVIFHRDGKTSTVAVKVIDDTYVLMNNGKPDAGLIIDSEKKSHISPDSSITDDQPTMVLLGTLPYVYQPEAKTVANIGLGSGLTAHTLLHSETLERLDSIEIEEAVFEAAEKFRPSVENIFIDNRSSIILEDAKTYFSASGNTYDVIVSEPPNPWVSGVSSLFSVEFYQEIKRYMNEDGVFVQWMHIYEISPYLISTIYLALNKNFSDIHFYQVSRNDIAIVASNRQLKADYTRPFFDEGLKEELSNININSANDIEVRKLAGKDKLDIVFLFLIMELQNRDF
jgi:spermidine synthase